VGWLDSPTSINEFVTHFHDIKSIGMDVGVDFHGRIHKGMAKQLSKLLEPHQPLFIQGT
jgi:galactonate dehydratase